MPYKSGSLKGELTVPELRRLVRQHNELMSLKIPPRTDRDGILALIQKNGYDVDHAGQKLVPRVKMKRKPVVKLPPAKPRAKRKPKAAKPKGDVQKEIDKRLKQMIKLGLRGPQGQKGTGPGGRWTVEDEKKLLGAN